MTLQQIKQQARDLGIVGPTAVMAWLAEQVDDLVDNRTQVGLMEILTEILTPAEGAAIVQTLRGREDALSRLLVVVLESGQQFDPASPAIRSVVEWLAAEQVINAEQATKVWDSAKRRAFRWEALGLTRMPTREEIWNA